MFDPIVLSLINQVARKGLDDDATAKLISLVDTLLSIEDCNSINVTNVQTLLLLLQDFDIKPTAKRLVDELRCRLIRQALGANWQHGNVVSEYTITEMNKALLEKNYTISVYEDDTVIKTPQYSIQPLVPKDLLILNDMGQLALADN